MARIIITIDFGRESKVSTPRINAVVKAVIDSMTSTLRRDDKPLITIESDEMLADVSSPTVENPLGKPREACTCSKLLIDRSGKQSWYVERGVDDAVMAKHFADAAATPGMHHNGGCPMYEFDPDEIPF